jgi:hypothetical protein
MLIRLPLQLPGFIIGWRSGVRLKGLVEAVRVPGPGAQRLSASWIVSLKALNPFALK